MMAGYDSPASAQDVSTHQGQTSGRNLIASDRVEGTAVRRSSGEKIGTIERLMIEKKSGQVVYAVMAFGGFLGMGEDHYTLPWSVLTYNTDLDAYEQSELYQSFIERGRAFYIGEFWVKHMDVRLGEELQR